MRKLYNEFFYIPKRGKIREKVMLARVATTIAIMVVCLAAMSITAYAYFSYNVTSDFNMIKAANFETAVAVQITDANGKAVDNSNITPITSDNKNFRVEGLDVGKWYSVTIKPTKRSTAQTGFIIVSADNCEVTYHTQQLGVDEGAPGGKTPEIRFKLMITDTTNVILKSHWGTSSFYPDFKEIGVDNKRYITLDEEIKMIINGHTEPNVSKDSTDTPGETTTTPSTDATTPTTGSEPSTESTTPSTETTETSEPTTTTEPSSTTSTEPTVTEPAVTEPVATEPTETTEPTGTQPAEEAAGITDFPS